MTIIAVRPGLGQAGQFSPAFLSAMSRRALPLALTSGAAGGAAGGAVSGPSEVCLCKAEATLSALGGSDPVLLNQLAAVCATNEAAFDETASAAGVDLAACKPWYMRKTTWIVGGLAAAAGVVLWLRR